jgi:hypothetical protein
LLGAFAVCGWLAAGVMLVRRTRAGASAELIGKTRRSLIFLTAWVALAAWRLATHTYN